MLNLEKNIENLKKYLETKDKISIDEAIKVLNINQSRDKNIKILRNLVENGDIIITKKEKIASSDSNGRARGILKVIKNHFAFIDREGKESIFVHRDNFNGALDGDDVIVKTYENANREKLEGEVIKIIKHTKNNIIGTFQKNKNFGFVVPTNFFGSDIYIRKIFNTKAKDGDLVLVNITSWGDANRKPEGTIKKVIGDANNSKNMIDALILREEVASEFSKEALLELKKLDSTISEDEIKKRVDLRKLSTITIDGETSKDLDDAVYVKKLKNGNYKLIVSIADVSHYIKLFSNLDKEAEERGNSVYLVDRVLPMFPKEISNGLCSLNEKEDKLTFSCELEIDKKANIIYSKTYKSIINSIHRMTYTDVNKIFDNDLNLMEKYKDILIMLNEMLELSKILRDDKYKRGSIDFELPEIEVTLNEKGKVDKIFKRERGEAEKIIEDFMIAANEAVARELASIEMPAVFRSHEKPDEEKILNLNETLSKFALKIDDIEDVSPKAIQKLVEMASKKGVEMIAHKMILMSMKQARYTVNNGGHFGLASKCYTHFTSPIRRYADLMVHRLLDDLHNKKMTERMILKNENLLPNICKHISETERKAMQVEEESKKIKICEYMQNKVNNIYLATVVGFSNKKVFFETEEFVECSFNVVDAYDYYEFDEKNYIMINTSNTSKNFELGDKIQIKIKKVDMSLLEISCIPLYDKKGVENDIS